MERLVLVEQRTVRAGMAQGLGWAQRILPRTTGGGGDGERLARRCASASGATGARSNVVLLRLL